MSFVTIVWYDSRFCNSLWQITIKCHVTMTNVMITQGPVLYLLFNSLDISLLKTFLILLSCFHVPQKFSDSQKPSFFSSLLRLAWFLQHDDEHASWTLERPCACLCLLLYEGKFHEILFLWKAWVTGWASHCIGVMMWPKHHDDRVNNWTCYPCISQEECSHETFCYSSLFMEESCEWMCVFSKRKPYSSYLFADFFMTFSRETDFLFLMEENTLWVKSSCCIILSHNLHRFLLSHCYQDHSGGQMTPRRSDILPHFFLYSEMRPSVPPRGDCIPILG